MASKTSSEKCGSQIKGGKAQETQNKLAEKLKLHLERDILRLFQDSVYCDIKFTVHSSSLLTHSCILRARASRFYKFIYAEFEVLEENGISVFNIYNASFTYLQTFVENIYTNVHSFHAEDKIIKHLKEAKDQPFENSATATAEAAASKPSVASAFTPDADLFFTPKCSPSELQKPFASPKLKISENDVASYYKITVDDIPLEEKSEGKKSKEEKELLEKELAEQDELLSSFQIIFSKKNKTKPDSVSVGSSSQPGKKTKPKFNRKFETNLLLIDGHDKNKNLLPHWKPSLVHDRQYQRDKYLGVKNVKKSAKPQEKVDLGNYVEDPTNSVSSDMDVSTTAGDSGLDVSLICQQETSPREVTMSETSGIDLTEAAINEDIPNDETISTKQSSGSSVTSEAGTWDGNDDFKVKSPSNSCAAETLTVSDNLLDDNGGGKRQLNEDEIIRLDEMEKNMRDCEMFLYMERQASHSGDAYGNLRHHSMTNDEVPGRLDDIETLQGENAYQYASGKQMNNPEESLQGETGRRRNYDEENSYNYSYSSGKNLDDAINPEDKNYESVDPNEFQREGVAGDTISSNLDYFAQPDILKDVKEARTPPCTPKKLKNEEIEESDNKEETQETKSRKWESNNNNNSTVVSNYFIDASSLLDEDEIISPPISLINFKSQHSFEEHEMNNNNSSSSNNNNNNNNNNNEEEEPKIVSKKVVTNFYAPDSTNDASFLKENERRQGEIIFKNSIPHYSKHEVEENQVLDSTERLRGGADNFSAVEDESEQVVPSADIDYSPPYSLVSKREPEECSYVVRSDYFEPVKPASECESESGDDYVNSTKDESRSNAGESVRDASSSTCSQSPNLRRRNESAPILSGGIDYVEEEKLVQKKPSQSQGEAWIVTFDDEKKPRTKSAENRMESREDVKMQAVRISGHAQEGRQLRRKEPPVEFYIDGKKNETNVKVKTELKAYPIEKSSSSGYFLDFSNDPTGEISEQPVEAKTEKKNMFSMFIGMDDNSTSNFPRKSKPTLEREGTFDKSLEDTNETSKSDREEDRKKPFYMFIESNSPNVKRKQIPRRPTRNNADAESEEPPARRSFLRAQSYTIERNLEERPKPEVKTDFECSSSDNSLPYSETNFRSARPVRGRLPIPFRGVDSNREPKITAWAETKQQSDSAVASESWLRTNDIQINYRGKNKELRDGAHAKKESTFTRGNEKHKDNINTRYKDSKPAERDSGVILSDKGDDSFVKLSDLDSMDSVKARPAMEDRMSHSISEDRSGKGVSQSEIPLSKSVGSEGGKASSKTFSDRGVNRSLSRLFPNMTAQSLARITDSDVQASETSEVSTSMQSSIDPPGLEMSTSETDVSSNAGTSSKLGEDLLKMFLEEINPDIVIEVNGRRIKAHKCILSSRCQYFAAALSGGWVESAGNVISLQGFDPECYETNEDRDILSDTKTKFVPPKYSCASSKSRRRTRTTYKPVAFQKVYAQLLDRRKRRKLRRIQMTYLRDFFERNLKRAAVQGEDNENGIQFSKGTGKSRKRGVCKRQKYKKRKDPWYSQESHVPDIKIYRQIDDDVDHEKQPLGEAEEGEEINIGPNYESWLLMRSPNSGEREVFHAFWKGEGNLKSIRKAQTKMMLSFMDPSVDPCQDFYQFACGNWGHKNPIPKDKAGYDTFEMLRESLDIVLQDLLMEEDNETTNEATLKTKNLYRSCMNNKILEERREKPLLVLLDSLGGWPMIDPNWKEEDFDWIVLMAKLRLFNNDILISEWVGPDIKNSDEYIIQFDQTSLGLPTREYFLEPCNYVYLEAYKNYLIKISTLLGSSVENAKAEAEDLMIFETALAEITSSPDERRNVSELYERMTVSELTETVPEINWVKYLTIVLNREVDPQEPVVMFALRYVQDLVKLLCQTEPRVVSNYLLWRFIRHRVNNLDDRFQEAKQHFYYILFGREEAPPRWKNCVAQVNTNMGMGLGAMFVARYFDEKSKNDTLEMTHDIMRSFREILNHTSWIDNETKRLAIQKVDAMMLRIGYPDFILNKEALNERYAEVNIDPELYFENTLNILKHLTRAEQDRLGTRVNKSMWNTPPAVVNAYYSRNKNQIMFPAGILQPPFYHRYFPRSLNYGGIGVVIGHEITHGFDDKGRLFDQDGNLHKWWKEPAIEAFHERAQCLIDQYSKYTVTEVGMQIDGVNTQGENIADNGGIKQAFKAYERWLSVHGDQDEVLQGINATNLQLFFLNFAQIWCGTMRPEATRNKLKTAVHSPGKFRVIGTLSNSEDFARVFQCEPGSPMNPIKKCSVWFSYNAVHFALRHIYSGESRIPESLSIVELATLADMLCLDGLQEIISYNLKVKYCHSFHVPCSVCSVGVIDCLPIAAAYGLDDLYRMCLRWITKYFVKIWPTKSFGSLPRELLEKCYKHFVVHMTVDNVLDTVVNIDRVRGSLPNVRWAESVSRLVNKLHDATVRYIAEHFSSILTSDNFLALGKEAGWNVSRLEDSLIETVRYLPPEQACWSHARLHRILSIATGPDPPPEMNWNENFLKLLQVIAELVENSLIKQAPRAAKSKAWRQMEPELRSRIQEAACLVLPDQDQSSGYRRSNYVKRDIGPPSIPQTAKSRNLELRQIKLAMTQQTTNRNPITNRPLSLQMDPRPKRDSRFIPLRTSASTSSVRKPEPPTEGIRKTQSRSHILGNTALSEPKKTVNPRYSEVKSRYLEPKSPLKSASEKPTTDSNQRRTLRYISSSDSSRNCSPALRSSNSRSSIPQAKKPNLEPSRQPRSTVLKSGSLTTLDAKRDRSFVSNRSDAPAVKTFSRLTKDEDMSTDSLCTDSLLSEKEATVRRRPGKENLGERRISGNSESKSNSNSPVSRRHSSESWSSTTSKTSAARKLTKSPNEAKSNPPRRSAAGKIPIQGVNVSNPCKSTVSTPRTTTAKKNQRNSGGKIDTNLVNGNSNRKRSEVDSENNKKNLKDTAAFQPSAVERSGTFLKDEPTILKKPEVGTEA